MATEAGLLWGAKAIADYLGLTSAQVYHRHAADELPTWKEGAVICARKVTLDAWLAEREAAARKERVGE